MKPEKVKKFLSGSAKFLIGLAVVCGPQLLLDAVTGILGMPHIDLSDSAQIYFEEGVDDFFKKL